MNAKPDAVPHVKQCEGGCYGWGTKGCTNPGDPKVSPHWCPACEQARRDHITKQLDGLVSGFSQTGRVKFNDEA